MRKQAQVGRALRQRANQRGESLNKLLVHEPTIAGVGHPQRADFTDLVGQWTPDAAFDEILAAQRRIDSDKWM